MQFAVIGLGVFGQTCARELQRLGNEVLGIDIDGNEVNAIIDEVSHAVIADATDMETLKELNIGQFDGVLVSIGDDLEANLLCTLNALHLPCKELWVKAKTDAHHTILESLGVEHIIHPEQQMGMRIAQAMNYPLVKQYLELSDQQFLIRIDLPKGWRPMALNSLHPKVKHTPLVMAIRGDNVFYNFDDSVATGSLIMQAGDRLVFSGELVALKKLSQYIASLV